MSSGEPSEHPMSSELAIDRRSAFEKLTSTRSPNGRGWPGVGLEIRARVALIGEIAGGAGHLLVVRRQAIAGDARRRGQRRQLTPAPLRGADVSPVAAWARAPVAEAGGDAAAAEHGAQRV